MKNIRFFSILLALLMVLTCFAACSDTGTDPADTTVPTVVTTENTTPQTESIYDANGYLKDEMGDFDFGGRDFTIFYLDDTTYPEFFTEGITGDNINDANYNRNAIVEQRTGVKLQYITHPGAYPNIDAFVEKVTNELQAGTQIDMILCHSMDSGPIAIRGLCMDLSNNTSFEWDKPWWPEYMMSQLKINGKQYFIAGDISVNTILEMYVTFFNKEMIDSRNLEDPYELVEKNQWNLDKMWELCKDTYQDTNNNGTVDFGDTFGTIFEWEAIDAYINAGGLTFLSNSNGEVTISAEMFGEQGINLFDKISSFAGDASAAYLYTESGADGSEGRREFSNGNLLFWVEPIGNTQKILDSAVDYGIVPVPKATAAQANFYTPVDFPYMTIIPYNVEDVETVSTVIEIIASESYRNTTHAVFEITMKYRYANDENASSMFDLLRSGMIFDLAMDFSLTFSHPYNTLRRTIIEGNKWSVVGKTLEKTMSFTLKKQILPAFD